MIAYQYKNFFHLPKSFLLVSVLFTVVVVVVKRKEVVIIDSRRSRNRRVWRWCWVWRITWVWSRRRPWSRRRCISRGGSAMATAIKSSNKFISKISGLRGGREKISCLYNREYLFKLFYLHKSRATDQLHYTPKIYHSKCRPRPLILHCHRPS